jgi:hypothetical protein
MLMIFFLLFGGGDILFSSGSVEWCYEKGIGILRVHIDVVPNPGYIVASSMFSGYSPELSCASFSSCS